MKTKTTVLLGISLAAFTITASAQSWLTNGLVAYYPFNGNANDASGNGYNGNVQGAALSVDRFGFPNQAYSFAGGLDSVIMTNLPANTGLGQSNTVSLWFKWTGQFYDSGDPGTYLFNWNIFNLTQTPPSYGLYVQKQASPRFGFGPGSGDVWGITYDESNFTNRWIHVVGVFVNGDIRQSLLYIDGQMQTCDLTVGGAPSGGPPWQAYANPTAIVSGYRSDSIQYHFFGGIDDVRIYNRALSSNEVAQLYALESEISCSPHRAAATATVVNDFVVGATITDPGCGYTNAPTVLIRGGGGSGATATAVVSNGLVVAINITSAGAGYTSTPQIRIASPPFEPTVSIAVSRVNVILHVVLGRNYVLESSPDLVTWTPTGPQFTADSETIVTEFVLESTGRFFRIRQVP